MGYFYQYGVGINKNEIKVFEWYLKFTKGGNSEVQYKLGYFYLYGTFAIKREETIRKNKKWVNAKSGCISA